MSIVPPDPASNKTDPPEVDYFDLASRATDHYWSELTGMCGGCGRGDCHSDRTCPTAGPGYCLVCPTRRETGEVR